MKTGKIAKSMGVDVKTIANWVVHPALQSFFSSGASKTEQAQRDFNESDLLVLNTIRAQRARNTDWLEIARILESGEREVELPPEAMLVETTAPIAQYGRIIALVSERDSAMNEVERLREINKEKDAAIDKLQSQIQQLNREIGKLEGKIEFLQDKD